MAFFNDEVFKVDILFSSFHFLHKLIKFHLSQGEVCDSCILVDRIIACGSYIAAHVGSSCIHLF